MGQLMIKSAVRASDVKLLPLNEYRRIILNFSGGKDSLAALLHLIKLLRAASVSLDQLELHHQSVDGAPGTAGLMDWTCTESYVRAVASALGLRLRMQWREGGFERELLRAGTSTGPVSFETDLGVVTRGGVGPPVQRRKFPQKGAPGTGRWCSPGLKKDVQAVAVRNDPAYAEGPILVVTGERREESPLRARYPEVEHHSTNCLSRRVDSWHLIIDWTEAEVWEIIRDNRILPHVAYFLGFSRVSCALCIFLAADHWATIRYIMPRRFERVAQYEEEFGCTIDRRLSVRALADRGRVFAEALERPDLVSLALDPNAYTTDMIILPHGAEWALPRGAFGNGGGPI